MVYDLPYIAEPSLEVFRQVDLRQNPSEINMIPELKDEPDLKSLVSVMNDKDGLFMTHGCALAFRQPEDYVVIPLSVESSTASHWCSSYVTFSFWQFSMNRVEEYEMLYEKFILEGKGSDICFVIQPAYFCTRFEQRLSRKWGETNGTVCVVWVSGWGDGATIALSRWRNAVKGLISFFSTIGTFDSQIDTAATTLSRHMFQE
jgi:hypothetical protein